MLAAVDAAAAATFGFLLLVPFVGPILFAAATTTFVTLRVALEGLLASLGGTDLGQALARVCNLAAATGQSWIVRDLVGVMVGQIRGPLDGGFAVGKSFMVMTSQPGCENLGEGPPHCMRQIDGLEIAFDARAGQHGYLDFVNGVSDLVEELLRRNQPVGVALSLRFTGRSEALLAMQQFDTTCSIEVIMLRGLPGNDEFMRRLQTLAYDLGGIPHWGLIHHVTRAQVNRFYGDRLTTWRQVLLRMVERSGGRVDTFSTRYSVEHDLEPLPSCTLPPEVGNFLVRILRPLAEALARRGGMSGGGMSGGGMSGGGMSGGRGSGGSGSAGGGRGGPGGGRGGQGGNGQGGGGKPPE